MRFLTTSWVGSGISSFFERQSAVCYIAANKVRHGLESCNHDNGVLMLMCSKWHVPYRGFL
jgi:hypothetical protein